MRKWRWCAVVLVAGSMLVTGCTSVTGGQASLPTKAPKSKPDHKDRDPGNVMPQLAKLDACALVPGKAVSHSGAKARPQGPYSCKLEPKGTKTLELSVVIGGKVSHLDRVGGEQQALGGAKTYQRVTDTRVSGAKSACEITVPTSFETSVHFQLDTVKRDSCAPLRSQVAAAIPHINAKGGSKKPTKRLGFGWTGCLIMGKLLGGKLKQYEMNSGSLSGSGLAECEASKHSGSGTGFKFELKYDMWDPLHRTRVAGKTADIHDHGDDCDLELKLGKSGLADDMRDTLVASVSGGSCKRTKSMAVKATKLLSGKPPKVDFKPLPRLTYKAGEPDEAERGACANFMINTAAGCKPAAPVAVPDNIHKALKAASDDNNVTCSAFHDAVTTAFGSQYEPISWGQHCFFVSARHPVQIQTNLNPGDPAGVYGDQPNLYSERKKLKIAGHPSIEFFDTDHDSYDIYVAPGHDLHKRGNIHIAIEAEPVSGALDRPNRKKLTSAQTAAAKRAITKTVRRFD